MGWYSIGSPSSYVGENILLLSLAFGWGRWDFGSIPKSIGLKTLFFLNLEKDRAENINLSFKMIAKEEGMEKLESQWKPADWNSTFIYIQRVKTFSCSSARYT